MERRNTLSERLVGWTTFLTELMAVSGLLLLGCLPVVTAGASCAAAYYTAVKALRRRRGGIWSCYWHSFRQNLKQGVLFSLLILAVGGLLLFYRFAMGSMEQFSTLYFALVALLTVVFLGVLAWLFPLLSRYSMTSGRMLAVSLLLAAGHPLRTLGVVALLLLSGVLTVLLPPLVLLLPGLNNWAASFLQEPVFRRLPQESGMIPEEDPWYLE